MKKNNFIDLYLDYFDRNFNFILVIIAIIFMIFVDIGLNSKTETNSENKEISNNQKEELTNQTTGPKKTLRFLEDKLKKKQINYYEEYFNQ